MRLGVEQILMYRTLRIQETNETCSDVPAWVIRSNYISVGAVLQY